MGEGAGLYSLDIWNKRKKPPKQKAKDPKLIVPEHSLCYFKQEIESALWDRQGPADILFDLSAWECIVFILLHLEVLINHLENGQKNVFFHNIDKNVWQRGPLLIYHH